MRLFISYAHVDKWQVTMLVQILRDGGHDPWFDTHLVAGQDWKEQLAEAIQSCEAFVYALTPESVASEWCQWEFAKAAELGKSIIPVLLQRNTELPTAIASHQYVDFTAGATPEAVARLMGGLTHVAITIPAADVLILPGDPEGKPASVDESVNPHVFLSYSRENLEIMHKVRESLRENGIVVVCVQGVNRRSS